MKKNKPIKFAHNFTKLHNQSKGKLIEVVGLNSDMLTRAAREYDTEYLDKAGEKQYYKLPEDCALVRLTFIGSLGIPFSALRRLKNSSWTGYGRKIHEEFDFVIEAEQVEEKTVFTEGD